MRFPTVRDRFAEIRARHAEGEFPLATDAQIDIAECVAAHYVSVCGEAYIMQPDAADGHINVGAVAGGNTAHVTIVKADGTSFVADGWGELTASSVARAMAHSHSFERWMDAMSLAEEDVPRRACGCFGPRAPVDVEVTFADGSLDTITAFPVRENGWHACPPIGGTNHAYATPRDAALAHAHGLVRGVEPSSAEVVGQHAGPRIEDRRVPVKVSVELSEGSRVIEVFPVREGWHAFPPKDRMKPVYATPTDAALAQARGLYDGAMPYWAEVIK